MSLRDYDNISPTARLVAEMRRHSDIPFAEEVATRMGSAELVREMLGGEAPAPELLSWMAPTLEARYKCLETALKAAGIKQIVELGSGFSFRGDAMNRTTPLRYIETDLPEMHETRLRLRNELRRDGVLPAQENVVFAPLNAVAPGDAAVLEQHLVPGEPVAVIHEGLLQYFTRDEKRATAQLIAGILKRHGGVWLTPDFEVSDDGSRERWTHPHFARIFSVIARSTQSNLRDAAFTHLDEVKDFFSKLGFRVTPRAQLDGTFALSSAERVGTTPEQLDILRRSRILWELRLD
ncbi:hypothetical protein F0U62_16570 [Cystobacter fuscus]|uniref:class I SAM-dependent methyltransferase n=1 Tax=Cystobacter fuscus TaxID=43 RepID=UPI002B302A0C|nr:hypothetical protein F0U62_16570 [Cystobacter fuscus]